MIKVIRRIADKDWYRTPSVLLSGPHLSNGIDGKRWRSFFCLGKAYPADRTGAKSKSVLVQLSSGNAVPSIKPLKMRSCQHCSYMRSFRYSAVMFGNMDAKGALG